MDSWEMFWTALLVITLVAFGILSVGIAIGGYRDIRAMFRTVDEQNRKQQQNESSPDEP